MWQLLEFSQDALPEAVRAAVTRLQDEAWPASQPSALLHDPALDPVIVVLADGGRVVAALAVLHRRLRHAGQWFSAAGLSAVTTDARSRGRGHGGRLVAAAHDRLTRSGTDLGLFTCDRPLQRFYERAGWHVLPGTAIVGGTPAAPLRSDEPGFDKVTMADFFTAHARRHRHAFEHTDIELYPGEVDRLW